MTLTTNKNIFDTSNFLIFNWWDQYHHVLIITILGILILLFALTCQKSAHTVIYINYLSFLSIILLLILSPINSISLISTLWFTNDYLYLLFYIIGSSFIALTLINVSELTFVKENKEIEFPMLIVMGLLAAVMLIGTTNLMAAFIALECLAFISYVLVAFERGHKLSSLAGVRYLFLGAVPTGLFVLGIIELYSFFGSFNLEDIEKLISGSSKTLEMQQIITDLSNTYTLVELNDIDYTKFSNYNSLFFNSNIFSILDLTNNVSLMNIFDTNLYQKNDIYYSDFIYLQEFNNTVEIYQQTFQNYINITNNEIGLLGETLSNLYSSVDSSKHETLGFFWVLDKTDLNCESCDVWLNTADTLIDSNNWSVTNIASLILDNNIFLQSNITENSLVQIFEFSLFLENLTNNSNNIILFDWINNTTSYLNEVFNELDIPYIPVIVKIAIILISTNLLFKITAAPFNMWAPRVYEGAPLPVVMFLSIFSKIAIIFFMIRFFLVYFYDLLTIWSPIFLICGILSMIAAITGAISETKIKRFFVYSSMSHVGLMLLALTCANIHGGKAIIIYLIVYTITSFGGWTIIMLLTNKMDKIQDKKITYITGLKGLSQNNALLSFFLAIIMLSMSGIPPLAGFFAKFEVLYALSETQLFSIAFLALLLSVISFFYYLRIIKVLYFDSVKNYTLQTKQSNEKAFILSLGFLSTIFFVLYLQQPLLYILKSTFLTFFNSIII